MPALLADLPEQTLATATPDGGVSWPELDLDLDVQDVDLYAPVPELEIALPGGW